MVTDRKFYTEIHTQEEANVITFGVPLGKNTDAVLQSIREVSWFVETFDIDKKRDLLENVKLFDIGNVQLTDLNKITEQTKSILDQKKIPLMLGGYHLSTLYALKAFENVKIVVFDAHADLKDEYEDEKIKEMNEGSFTAKTNDATWLRRALEFVNPKNVLLIGIRSCDETELAFMQEKGIQYFTANQVQDNTQEVVEAVHEFTKDVNVYVNVDIDGFDPSVAPAVDHLEPNGIMFKHFSDIVNAINGRIVGMDLCCLKTSDNQVTEFLAIKVLFEILGKL